MPWLTGNSPLPGHRLIRVKCPNEQSLVAASLGALLPLIYINDWEKDGDLTPDEAAEYMREPILKAIMGEEFFMLGAIYPYVTQNPPAGTLPCDGGVYNKTDYPELYNLLDSFWIIDADTFSVPLIVERFVFGASLSPTGDYQPGATGGEIDHALTESEIPSHTHTIADHSHTDTGHVHTIGTETVIPSLAPGENPTLIGVPLVPSNTGSASANLTSASLSPANTGGGDAHNNMPPYLALKYCIVAE